MRSLRRSRAMTRYLVYVTTRTECYPVSAAGYRTREEAEQYATQYQRAPWVESAEVIPFQIDPAQNISPRET